MSWPRENEGAVKCIGFDKKYLPAIKMAVDNGFVKWGKCDLFISMCTAEFTWAGCTWEMVEMQECVTSISLIKGIPSDESLTVAVLKG